MGCTFPSIRRYVAVSDVCRERLVSLHGIAPELVRVVPNFVDLARFPVVRRLPAVPKRALVFSNAAREDNFLPIVRAAAATRGIEVDAIGAGVGRVIEKPEEILPEYDLVFARGRAALEAIVSGAAVVVCDAEGLGDMSTPETFDRFRTFNFGLRLLQGPITYEGVLAAIARYDASASARVTERARNEVGLEHALDQILEVYEAAIADRWQPDRARELRAVSSYIRDVADIAKARNAAMHDAMLARSEAAMHRASAEQLGRELVSARAEASETRAALEVAQGEVDRRQSQLYAMRETRVWRLRRGFFRWRRAIRESLGRS
jgi:hypothetical protein